MQSKSFVNINKEDGSLGASWSKGSYSFMELESSAVGYRAKDSCECCEIGRMVRAFSVRPEGWEKATLSDLNST